MGVTAPRSLLFWIGEGCNSRCIMCWVDRRQLAARRFMDVGIVRFCLERYPELQDVNLSAFGEPLLHPQIGEIMRLARERGCSISCCTNGALPGWTDGMATSPGVLTVSCDSPDPVTYATIRRGLQLRDVVRNLEALQQHPDRHPGRSVNISMVVLRNNRRQIAAMAKLAHGLGVSRIAVRRGYGLLPELKELELVPDDQVVAEQLEMARSVGIPIDDVFSPATPCTVVGLEEHCQVPWDWAAVFWDGRVVPCCNSDDTMGCVAEDFWGGERYCALRTQIEAGSVDAGQFPGCARCPALFPARWHASAG